MVNTRSAAIPEEYRTARVLATGELEIKRVTGVCPFCGEDIYHNTEAAIVYGRLVHTQCGVEAQSREMVLAYARSFPNRFFDWLQDTLVEELPNLFEEYREFAGENYAKWVLDNGV